MLSWVLSVRGRSTSKRGGSLLPSTDAARPYPWVKSTGRLVDTVRGRHELADTSYDFSDSYHHQPRENAARRAKGTSQCHITEHRDFRCIYSNMQQGDGGGIGFITPHFELSQDNDFVIVAIRLPSLRSSKEGEFYVLGKEFKFYLKPYFLRLTFRHELVEDGRERAEHDMGTGILRVWLPKAVAGEHFGGLDMLTELLRRPEPQRARGPLIEVVGSFSDAAAAEDGESSMPHDSDEAGGMASDNDGMSGDEFHVEQEFPRLEIGSGDGPNISYGFNNAYSAVFTGLESEGLLLLASPEQTRPAERKIQRLVMEDDAFDPEYYMADYMEDDGAQEAMKYVPWWDGPEADRWRSQEAAAAGPTEPLVAEVAAAVPPVPTTSSASTLPHASPFAMGSDYQQALLTLPRKEFLLTRAAKKAALLGLVDLLAAHCYDVRTTGGDQSVESGWTIRRLSALLSHLDERFENVLDVAVSSVRRCLCYPLVRHFDLATRVVLTDVVAILRLGRSGVLRCLLDARAAVQRNGEYGYLLNKIWIDDYSVWVQQSHPENGLPAAAFDRLADQLAAVQITKDMVRWPLDGYEEVARQSGEEDAPGAGAIVVAGTELVEEEEEEDDDDSDVSSGSDL